jgi:hypothetical protein
VELAEKSGIEGYVRDDIYVAEKHFRWLKELAETGKLPIDARAANPKAVQQPFVDHATHVPAERQRE